MPGRFSVRVGGFNVHIGTDGGRGAVGGEGQSFQRLGSAHCGHADIFCTH